MASAPAQVRAPIPAAVAAFALGLAEFGVADLPKNTPTVDIRFADVTKASQLNFRKSYGDGHLNNIIEGTGTGTLTQSITVEARSGFTTKMPTAMNVNNGTSGLPELMSPPTTLEGSFGQSAYAYGFQVNTA